MDSEGLPIPDATISLIIEMGGCPSTQTATDANGRFEFPGARPGRYRVEAVRIDHVAQQFGERERGTPGFGATIVLVPSALHREITIVLDHGSRITGNVYDEEGKPLSGGYVFFDNPDVTSQGFSVRTDVNGAYRAYNLPAGNYHVSARRFSVQANQVVGDLWHYPGVLDQQLAALVVARADSPAIVDIHFGNLRPAAGIFRVRTDNGAPVARAEVWIYRQTAAAASESHVSWTHHDVVRTGADGIAEVRTLPPGEYCATVSVLPPALAPWRNPAAATTSLERYAQPFSVVAGQGPVSIDFVVTGGLELSGRFLTRNGEAPPSVHGISLDLEGSPRVAGFTGSMRFWVKPAQQNNDSFSFRGLSAGEPYVLRRFQGDRYEPWVIVGIRLNGRSLAGDAIVLSSGGAVLDLILDRSAVVSGVLKGDTRSGTATARRLAGDAPAALFRETSQTEVADGRFVFRGLPPGSYEIAAPGRNRTQKIEVRAGEVVELSF